MVSELKLYRMRVKINLLFKVGLIISSHVMFNEGDRHDKGKIFLSVKLNDLQKAARVDAAFTDLAFAFRKANPGLEDGMIREYIAQSYARRDEEMEQRVVSTSKFGDLVVEGIMQDS